MSDDDKNFRSTFREGAYEDFLVLQLNDSLMHNPDFIAVTKYRTNDLCKSYRNSS